MTTILMASPFGWQAAALRGGTMSWRNRRLWLQSRRETGKCSRSSCHDLASLGLRPRTPDLSLRGTRLPLDRRQWPMSFVRFWHERASHASALYRTRVRLCAFDDHVSGSRLLRPGRPHVGQRAFARQRRRTQVGRSPHSPWLTPFSRFPLAGWAMFGGLAARCCESSSGGRSAPP